MWRRGLERGDVTTFRVLSVFLKKNSERGALLVAQKLTGGCGWRVSKEE